MDVKAPRLAAARPTDAVELAGSLEAAGFGLPTLFSGSDDGRQGGPAARIATAPGADGVASAPGPGGRERQKRRPMPMPYTQGSMSTSTFRRPSALVLMVAVVSMSMYFTSALMNQSLLRA